MNVLFLCAGNDSNDGRLDGDTVARMIVPFWILTWALEQELKRGRRTKRVPDIPLEIPKHTVEQVYHLIDTSMKQKESFLEVNTLLFYCVYKTKRACDENGYC